MKKNKLGIIVILTIITTVLFFGCGDSEDEDILTGPFVRVTDAQLYLGKNNGSYSDFANDEKYQKDYETISGYSAGVLSSKVLTEVINDSFVTVENSKISLYFGEPLLTETDFLGLSDGRKGIVITDFIDENQEFVVDFSKDGTTRIAFMWIDSDLEPLEGFSYTTGEYKFDAIKVKKGWNTLVLNEYTTTPKYIYRNISDISDFKWAVWGLGPV